jgi:hypothetical protein
VPATGYYFVWAVPSLNNPGFDMKGRLTINGVSIGFEPEVSGFTTIGYQGPTCFWIKQLNEGDLIRSQVWGRNNDSPPGGGWGAKTQMGMIRISNKHCLLSSVTPFTGPVTFAKLPFSTVQSDPKGMAGTDRITIKSAGYYMFLSNVDRWGNESRFQKNGSGVALKSSYAYSPSEFSRMDMAVDFFNAGDYVEMFGTTGNPIGKRLFGCIFLGGAAASLAYVYPTADHGNSEAPGGPPNQQMYPRLDLNGEWFDTDASHPYVISGSYADGVFSRNRVQLAPGISFAACKFNAQGYFTGNAAIQIRKNDVDAFPYVATSRGGSAPNVCTQFALLPAAAGDFASFFATMSDLGTRSYYGTYTSAYVGDVAGPAADDVYSMYFRMQDKN